MDPRAWRRFKKNKGAIGGLILVCIVTLLAFLGPVFAPYDESTQFTEVLILDNGLPASPFEKEGHPLGGDSIGRDELSRLLFGGRVSMLVAFAVTAMAAVIGIFIGMVTGFFGGKIDFFAMRFVDVVLSLPFLIIATAVQASIENAGLVVLCTLLGFLSWMTLARVVRSKTMQVRELEYVQAARALGMSTLRVLFRHVLPNILGPAVVIITTMVANVIIAESALSFLGFGVKPPTSSWGSMMKDGQAYLANAPHLVILPGVLIMMAVFGFNMFGEGLRDALDPKDAR